MKTGVGWLFVCFFLCVCVYILYLTRFYLFIYIFCGSEKNRSIFVVVAAIVVVVVKCCQK